MAKCSRIGELEHLRQRRRRQVWTFLKAKRVCLVPKIFWERVL
jgi:hypothetical protein